MSAQNPYNCTKPGNLFVGREDIQQKILGGLDNEHSFAILGGRRIGKTSLLLQLENTLRTRLESGENSASATMVPVYLDIQQFGALDASTFFERCYSQSTDTVQVPAWNGVQEARAYDGFLEHLRKAQDAMQEKYGRRWVVVLLVDELDLAATRLSDDQVFHNLRNLLMVSEFHRHFRLVASGVTGMQKLIASGSPLNNLRSTYLSVLERSQAARLLASGFPNGTLSTEHCNELFDLSGRHPCVLQGLLEYVWSSMFEHGQNITSETIAQAGRELLREHSFFSSWWETLTASDHDVYQALAASVVQEERFSENDSSVFMDDALTVLSYHGVIDDSDSDSPFVTGTLFRNWYLNKAILDPPGPVSTARELETEPAVSYSPKRIKLFLASSSELAAIRDSIELFLRRKNDNKALDGIYLEVIRWENFLDAMAEEGLQAEYNKAVKSCHVFVSLFRTKTGAFTEEEFNVAHQSFLETGFPKIYTLFEKATVSTDISNREPLLSLWRFQDRLRDLKHYYTMYDNEADLQLRLFEQLMKLVDRGVFDDKKIAQTNV